MPLRKPPPRNPALPPGRLSAFMPGRRMLNEYGIHQDRDDAPSRSWGTASFPTMKTTTTTDSGSGGSSWSSSRMTYNKSYPAEVATRHVKFSTTRLRHRGSAFHGCFSESGTETPPPPPPSGRLPHAFSAIAHWDSDEQAWPCVCRYTPKEERGQRSVRRKIMDDVREAWSILMCRARQPDQAWERARGSRAKEEARIKADRRAEKRAEAEKAAKEKRLIREKRRAKDKRRAERAKRRAARAKIREKRQRKGTKLGAATGAT